MTEKQNTVELLKKVRSIELSIRGIVNELFAGEYHSVFKGRGIEFAEVREYMPGDDVRTIDWNVTARMNHPYVKNFHEEREMTVMLMFDGSASGHFATKGQMKNELAVELAALLASSAIKNNDKVGLIIFTDQIEVYIPPRKGRQHIFRLIRELLAFSPENPGTDIGMALEFLNHVLKKKSTVFLLSDLWDKKFEKPLKVVSKKHDMIVLQLIDPFEQNIPASGLLEVIDPESGRYFTVDVLNAENRKIITDNFNKHQDFLTDLFTKSKTDRVQIMTNEPYYVPLTKFFKQREKRFR
ncbi:MAG: DUF58 domain-containing protein [Calditrichia bacterium]|nr:DUF58 domain-containing protein [Calditrichia bacterium]